jgi:hypothetical protein
MKCVICFKNQATELHHRFSQTKLNRKLYPEYIHDPKNTMYLCYDCHHNKLPGWAKWSEREFCENFGIKPRSKSGKFKMSD